MDRHRGNGRVAQPHGPVRRRILQGSDAGHRTHQRRTARMDHGLEPQPGTRPRPRLAGGGGTARAPLTRHPRTIRHRRAEAVARAGMAPIARHQPTVGRIVLDMARRRRATALRADPRRPAHARQGPRPVRPQDRPHRPARNRRQDRDPLQPVRELFGPRQAWQHDMDGHDHRRDGTPSHARYRRPHAARRTARHRHVGQRMDLGHRPRPTRPAPGSGTRRLRRAATCHRRAPRRLPGVPRTPRGTARTMAGAAGARRGRARRPDGRGTARTRGRSAGTRTAHPAGDRADQGAAGGPVDPRQGRPRLHDGDVQRARPRAHARQALPVLGRLDPPARTMARRLLGRRRHRLQGSKDVRHRGPQPVPTAGGVPGQRADHRHQGLPHGDHGVRQAQTGQGPEGHDGRHREGQRDPRRVEPMGVQGPRPRAKAHRPVQPQIQRHAAPPRRRILPDHARHHPRRRPASASEGRGGPRPAQRRGHPHRARRRSRQDVRGRHTLPRGETSRQGVQADARGPQPPRGPVGRRRAQALSGQPNPRHGQRTRNATPNR